MPNNNEPSGAEKMFGDFAPALVHFTDEVLFGEVWTRTQELAARDRSLITVASLLTSGSTEQLVYHLRPGQGERSDGAGADRGDHPPRLVRRLAEGDVRDGRRKPRCSAASSAQRDDSRA
jgi:hypothetical protein